MSKRFRNLSLALLIGVTPVVLGGCPDDNDTNGPSVVPIDTQTATVNVNGNTRTNLSTFSSGLSFSDESSVLADLGIDELTQGDCVTSVPSDGPVVDLCSDTPATGPIFDLERGVDDVADWLEESVFNEANVVSQTETSVTYEIPISAFCGEETPDDFPPQTSGEGDVVVSDEASDGAGSSGCDLLAENPIRVRVTSPTEGDFDAEILVGPDSLNPIDFRVYRNELAAVVDLSAVRGVLEIFVPAEDLSVLGDMRGSVELAMTILGQDHFAIAASVLSDIALSFSVDGQTFALNLGATSPAARLEVNGPAGQILATINMGAFDASLPTSMMEDDCIEGFDTSTCGPDPINGTLSMHLGGITGTITIDDALDVVSLVGMGLGGDTSWVQIEGNRIAEIDINPDSGRRFDLTASVANNTISLAFSPELALSVGLYFQRATQYLPNPADWILDEDLFVGLTGNTPTLTFPIEGDSSEVFQVTSGTVTLTSRARDLEIIANEGECLWPDETSNVPGSGDVGDPDEHPFQNLLSGTCP